MPQLELTYLILFVAFVLPGAMSMYVYGLLVPQGDHALKDRILEAICFSLINFVLLFWLIEILMREGFIGDHPALSWSIGVISFLLAPAAWPILLVMVLKVLALRRLVLFRAKTGWDHFFHNRQEGCFVVARLVDGKTVGGRYGRKSFASAYPNPGHIFIEELWEIGEDGAFTGNPLPGNEGIILRPGDYQYIRVMGG